jgi:hypothetical protein
MEVLEFLTPNSTDFQKSIEELTSFQLGNSVDFVSDVEVIDSYEIAIVCVRETRGANNGQIDFDVESIKYEFYKLYKGNWDTSILDLGHIFPGENITDTYYVIQKLVNYLLKAKIIPVILGGSQDLSYCQYRAYDAVKYMVNMTNIDFKFDLGDSNQPLDSESFLSHMIVEKPYNLFNYCNIGFQTYLNTQEEIRLLGKMFFEAYRLGEITSDIKTAEPILRDSDLVTVDVRAIENRSIGEDISQVNGFNNREICALARYSGLSDKVSSFGIYELQHLQSNQSKKLIAQMLWYFVEGMHYRLNEQAHVKNVNFIKYKVPVEDEVLVFYESNLSGRWWIEIPSNSQTGNNKLEQHTLLPCDKENYLSACDQEIPERWFKAKQKNEF